MGSAWRETASEQAQEQLDELLDASLGTAQDLLGKNGEFYPFAIVFETGASDPGIVQILEGFEEDRPPSQLVIDRTLDQLRDRRDDLDAIALIVDAVVEGSDAITVGLEHRDGPSLTVTQPYRKKKLGRRFDYGELAASERARQVWD